MSLWARKLLLCSCFSSRNGSLAISFLKWKMFIFQILMFQEDFFPWNKGEGREVPMFPGLVSQGCLMAAGCREACWGLCRKQQQQRGFRADGRLYLEGAR